MTELVNDSTDRSPDPAAYAASLMHHYGFDCGGGTIASLLLVWQKQYTAAWIRLATIEALYQGRYKAISVAQILALWQRRGQPVYHFNHEFERLICERLPQPLAPTAPSTQEEPFSLRSAQAIVAKLPYHTLALPLPHAEDAPLPNADAMQALRTLHDAAANTLDSLAESNKPSLGQTYSYTLRSEPSSQPSAPEQSAPLARRQADPIPSVLLSLDPAASVLANSDETVQAQTIALKDPRSDVTSDIEQIHATKQSADPSLPVKNSAHTEPITPQAASIARILQQLDNQQLSAEIMLPGIGLLAQTLQPTLRLHPATRYQPIWLSDPSNRQPIHQFTPTPEASDFHSKLKLVAQVSDQAPDGEACEPPLIGG